LTSSHELICDVPSCTDRAAWTAERADEVLSFCWPHFEAIGRHTATNPAVQRASRETLIRLAAVPATTVDFQEAWVWDSVPGAFPEGEEDEDAN
jgi:hypothetical protein